MGRLIDTPTYDWRFCPDQYYFFVEKKSPSSDNKLYGNSDYEKELHMALKFPFNKN